MKVMGIFLTLVSAIKNYPHDQSPDNERFHTLHRLHGTVCHRRFNNYLTLRLLNEKLNNTTLSASVFSNLVFKNLYISLDIIFTYYVRT